MSTTAELKHELLKLLREDEEFRLVVAGLLGLDAILGELKKLREDFNKLYESVVRRLDSHEEELKKLREDFLVFVKEQERRWEENDKKWEELNKRWEENNRRWEENNKRWEENDRKWEEAFKRFEELERRVFRVEEGLSNVEKRVSRVELSLGALTEVTLTRYAWEDVRDDARLRGEEVTARQRSAIVDGFEVDMLVETDKSVYVVEVKVKPTVDDVRDLLSKAEVVRKKYGKPVVPVLAGALIGDDVKSFAKGRAVEIYSY